MRINQNVMANNASRNLTGTNVQLGKSLEKLSSGFRINRAADDAAGLVVSQGLRAQVGGLKQATRNAQDGISVVQTAEGALNEVHTMLGRMRDLAVQAANSGGNDAAARTAAQTEINQLSAEITRVSDKTRFGGVSLLDGTYGVSAATQTAGSQLAQGSNAFDNIAALTTGATFGINIGGTTTVAVGLGGITGTTKEVADQVTTKINDALKAAGNVHAGKVSVTGSYTPSTASASPDTSLFSMSVSGLEAGKTFETTAGTTDALALLGLAASTNTATGAKGSGGTFQIGANANDTLKINIGKVDAGTLKVATLDVTTDVKAAEAITALDAAISSVSTTRGDLGATQNRFESMINNLQVSTENISASESRIRDTDMAQEMVSFTKNQVLQQAGTAMLSQANQIPQSILSLLR